MIATNTYWVLRTYWALLLINTCIITSIFSLNPNPRNCGDYCISILQLRKMSFRDVK